MFTIHRNAQVLCFQQQPAAQVLLQDRRFQQRCFDAMTRDALHGGLDVSKGRGGKSECGSVDGIVISMYCSEIGIGTGSVQSEH